MNLRDLEYVAAIAEFGSMAQAAAHCHVSQSTLSIQLKKLETELGVMIFERNSKRLSLTAAGKPVLTSARKIVEESRHLRAVARAHHDPFAVTFRLGIFPTLAPYYLPKAIPAVGAAFPRLMPQLIEEKSPLLLERLSNGDLDAALLALPVEGTNLAMAALFDDDFLLACPATHPLAKRKNLTMHDLSGETLLLLDDGHCLRNQALEVCAIARARESGDFRATSLETLRQMVASGSGITLMPRIAATPTPGMVYIPFTGPNLPRRKIGLVWRASSAQIALIKALVKPLKAAATS
jgi:LysR family hydrogen peroxide-inducible transcriptional activator